MKITDEEFDKFLSFLNVDILPFQKMVLRHMIENDQPLRIVMPRKLGYYNAMIMAERICQMINAETEMENDPNLR
jgi:hypothetical protein